MASIVGGLLAAPRTAYGADGDDAVGAALTAGQFAALPPALQDRLTPEHYAAQAEAAWRSSQLFTNSLMNCPVTDGVKVFDRDGRCFWAQIKGGEFQWDRTSNNVGGSENIMGGAWGVQGALDRYWRLGAAFSVEQSEIQTQNSASSEGDRVQAGVMIKGSFDQTMLSAALFAGRAWYNTNRLVALTQPGETAEGRSDVALAGGAFRLSHSFKLPGWYLKPLVDVSATYLSYGDLNETGAFPVRLAIAGEDKWVFGVTPALEAGTLVWIDPDTLARPFLRVGVTMASDAGFQVSSHFEAAPGALPQLTVNPRYDDMYGQITVGVDIFRSDAGVNFSFAYDGQFGEHTVYSVGSAKLRIAF